MSDDTLEEVKEAIGADEKPELDPPRRMARPEMEHPVLNDLPHGFMQTQTFVVVDDSGENVAIAFSRDEAIVSAVSVAGQPWRLLKQEGYDCISAVTVWRPHDHEA
jgi:hypothetical protein